MWCVANIGDACVLIYCSIVTFCGPLLNMIMGFMNGLVLRQ